MERKSVLILIGALLLAGATAATAYSRLTSLQQVSQGTYPGTGGNMGMNGMMGRGMMEWGYGEQQTATSSNATTVWNLQEMWDWCRNMMSGFGPWPTGQTNSSLQG